MSNSFLLPNENELPSSYADRLGLQYTSLVSSDHKKGLGQFFTPVEIANYMATFYSSRKKRIRVLDPGCGTGVLSCALIESLVKNKRLKEVELLVFETDPEVIALAEKSFEYLRRWLEEYDITFTHYVCVNDFILHNSSLFTTARRIRKAEQFDVVITNPPYFKLPKDDPRAVATQAINYGQPNIYSLFLIVSAKLLKKDGDLIFITPRSFTSGNYFSAFRDLFLSLTELRNIHLFGSRRDAFSRDEILQETLIAKAVRINTNYQYPIRISTSNGIKDLPYAKVKEYDSKELIDFSSEQKVIHLPVSSKDESVIKISKTWKTYLIDHNIQISTGKVVDFRAKEFILNSPNTDAAPLIWLHNIEKAKFNWPVHKERKGQFIKEEKKTMALLIPNRNYIFLRRFSSKDDNSRLVATMYYKESLPYKYIGVENHLNYIYKVDGELTKTEAAGLCALLNSTFFDTYFRTFNGNINVSATEIRGMKFPDLDTIKKIGNKLRDKEFSQRTIDEVVEQSFNLQKSLPILYE